MSVGLNIRFVIRLRIYDIDLLLGYHDYNYFSKIVTCFDRNGYDFDVKNSMLAKWLIRSQLTILITSFIACRWVGDSDSMMVPT